MALEGYQTLEISGKIISVEIFPHLEFGRGRKRWQPRKGCWSGFGVVEDLRIEICIDHTNPLVMDYLIEHEGREMMYALDPSRLLDHAESAQIPTRDAHNLANAYIYQLAASRGELDILHKNWLGSTIEASSSRRYRERLFEHFLSRAQ